MAGVWNDDDNLLDEMDWEAGNEEKDNEGEWYLNDDVDDETITVELLEEKEIAEIVKKKVRPVRRWTREEKALSIEMHKSHLAALISRTLLLNEWANDTTLQSAILSCIPLSVLNTPEIYCHSSQNRPVSYWSTPPGITRLMAWMNIWLEIVGGGEEVADIDGGAGSASSRLVNALSTRKVTGHEAIQIFLALCRAMNVQARFVACLDPIPPIPLISHQFGTKRSPIWVELLISDLQKSTPAAKKSEDSHATVVSETVQCKRKCDDDCHRLLSLDAAKKRKNPSSLSPEKSKRSRIRDQLAALDSSSSDDTSDSNEEDASETDNICKLQNEYREQNIGKLFIVNNMNETAQLSTMGAHPSMRWVHVDPIRDLIDMPLSVEQSRPRKQRMPYVIAIDYEGTIKDVTRRYASEWGRIMKMRRQAMTGMRRNPEAYWWKSMLDHWNTGRSVKDITIDKQEESDLCAAVSMEPLPTTLTGLRQHPTYCSSVYIKKSEILRPGSKPVGVIKGHTVYLRKDLEEVKSLLAWEMIGRKVMEKELSNPRLSRSGVQKAVGQDEEGTESVPLYGLWQTEQFKPKPVCNGIIPRSGYNTVDLWNGDLSFLPRGAAYVNPPEGGHLVPRICRELGVDYVPVKVGFSFKKGGSIPRIQGYAVCKEHKAAISSALEFMVHEEAKMVDSKREKSILLKWKKIVQLLMKRSRLREEYGH